MYVECSTFSNSKQIILCTLFIIHIYKRGEGGSLSVFEAGGGVEIENWDSLPPCGGGLGRGGIPERGDVRGAT